MLTASTNRAVLQPTRANRERRKSRIKSLQAEAAQHNQPGETEDSEHRDSNSSSNSSTILHKGKERLESLPVIGKLVRKTSTSSADSHSSQLVDLVVEDHEAEKIERMRARKEGGPGWNSVEAKHFVKTFPDADAEAQEVVRQGFNPDRPEKKVLDEAHGLAEPRHSRDQEEAVVDEEGFDEVGQRQPWDERVYGDEEREVWGDSARDATGEEDEEDEKAAT